MLVHDTKNAKNSIISGIYAPAQSRDKHDFWEHLSQLHNMIDIPWCILGNFNEIARPNEKLGGPVRISTDSNV